MLVVVLVVPVLIAVIVVVIITMVIVAVLITMIIHSHGAIDSSRLQGASCARVDSKSEHAVFELRLRIGNGVALLIG